MLLIHQENAAKSHDSSSFVNFETPHVHPLDLSPDGSTLAACNTPDNRIEIFAVQGDGSLVHTDSILVGHDPCSVRFRTDTEVWAVNLISDTVSVVDLTTGIVIDTIHTADEPADVVFYQDDGNPDVLAAVSCSRPDLIEVYDAATHLFVDSIDVLGQEPRALATDGTNVYAAVFNSGNSTTILGNPEIFSATANGAGPYGGLNPPPHTSIAPADGWEIQGETILRSELPAPPPEVGIIVRKDFSDGDKWKDENGEDWTSFVSGANAPLSGRAVGWDMTDNDIIGFATTNGTTDVIGGFGTGGYVTRRMNNGMALGVNPGDGSLLLAGLEHTNEIRFEPAVSGTFARVMVAISNGATGAEIALADMNEEHLDAAQGGAGMAYVDGNVPQAERDKSIGDPRGVTFDPTGARAYITGMGSNNVVVLNAATGARIGGTGHTVEVGEGPTGIVYDGAHDQLYVLNKFESSLSIVDASAPGSEAETDVLPIFTPEPASVRTGRVHFYGTHENSGLGQIACASCHIDTRNEQLAWDLGDPFGEVKPVQQVDPANPLAGQHNLFLQGFVASFDDFHFMKGPMTTQTLMDIIGKEPHHWRGDRDGLEQFSQAFAGLQGDDAALPAGPMQQFENFLASLHFGPNPFRALDNSLPGGPKFVGAGDNPNLPLPGFHSNGPTGGNPGLSARGTPLPDGDAWRGFQLYVEGNPLHTGGNPQAPEPLDSVFQCVTCHSLPTGAGFVDFAQFNGAGFDFVDIAPGPFGEAHQAMVSVDGTGENAFKIAHLRNQLDKQGFNAKPDPNNGGLPHLSTHGFGILHDGSIDNLDTFIGSNVFDMDNDQDLADVLAFTLTVNGDGFEDLAALPGAPVFFSPPGLPLGSGLGQLGPDGGDTQTAHAAVGAQVTLHPPSKADPPDLNTLLELAGLDKIDLVAQGILDGERRTWHHVSGSGDAAIFQSDREGETITHGSLKLLPGAGAALTYTAVPENSGVRVGADRDEDGLFNSDETDLSSDPANPGDVKWVDAENVGLGDGTEGNPYKTIQQGVGGLQRTPGKNGVLRIKSGKFEGPVTIDSPTSLRAEGGPVLIGG